MHVTHFVVQLFQHKYFNKNETVMYCSAQQKNVASYTFHINRMQVYQNIVHLKNETNQSHFNQKYFENLWK
jgi:uncharacterized membrane protein